MRLLKISRDTLFIYSIDPYSLMRSIKLIKKGQRMKSLFVFLTVLTVCTSAFAEKGKGKGKEHDEDKKCYLETYGHKPHGQIEKLTKEECQHILQVSMFKAGSDPSVNVEMTINFLKI